MSYIKLYANILFILYIFCLHYSTCNSLNIVNFSKLIDKNKQYNISDSISENYYKFNTEPFCNMLDRNIPNLISTNVNNINIKKLNDIDINQIHYYYNILDLGLFKNNKNRSKSSPIQINNCNKASNVNLIRKQLYNYSYKNIITENINEVLTKLNNIKLEYTNDINNDSLGTISIYSSYIINNLNDNSLDINYVSSISSNTSDINNSSSDINSISSDSSNTNNDGSSINSINDNCANLDYIDDNLDQLSEKYEIRIKKYKNIIDNKIEHFKQLLEHLKYKYNKTSEIHYQNKKNIKKETKIFKTDKLYRNIKLPEIPFISINNIKKTVNYNINNWDLSENSKNILIEYLQDLLDNDSSIENDEQCFLKRHEKYILNSTLCNTFKVPNKIPPLYGNNEFEITIYDDILNNILDKIYCDFFNNIKVFNTIKSIVTFSYLRTTLLINNNYIPLYKNDYIIAIDKKVNTNKIINENYFNNKQNTTKLFDNNKIIIKPIENINNKININKQNKYKCTKLNVINESIYE